MKTDASGKSEKTSKKKYDLEERLIDFSIMIIDIVENLDKTRAGNYIAGQLIISGLSPALNYGEAQSAESRNDFIHKMKISLKELRETFVALKIIKKGHLIKKTDILENCIIECNELISIFVKSIETAKKNNNDAS